MSNPPVRASWTHAGGDRAPSRRRAVLAAVLLCVNLPGAIAALEGARFYAHNRSTDFIVIEGERRGYLLHVPPGADRSAAMPLVISLHGGGSWGAVQRDISRWNDLADREGFIVAYPSGRGRASSRSWPTTPGPGLMLDIEFLTRLIDTVVVRHNADPARVYVNGLSNGGGMTFALSCAAAHRIAAVGMVSSAQTLDWSFCADAPPVPAVFFHGTADPLIPYEGGETWILPQRFPSIPRFVARWAERNGCETTPRDVVLSATVTRRAYSACAGAADVVLYSLQGDGHVWPGGAALPEWLVGRDSRTLDATAVMWEFFRERRATR